MSEPILCLVDIAHADSAVALLRHAQKTFPGRDMHVAYVMPYGFFSYVEPYVSKESQLAAAERASSELASILVAADLQHGATPHILRGGIGEQSLRFAEKLRAEFIVMNAMRKGSTHTTLGTHAAQITRHAKCSVCVVRH
jgi:nucleotide-binding universal stress UspA family protein